MNHYTAIKACLMKKIKSGSFSRFGGMTSQNFPLNKGTSHRIRIFFSLKMGLTLKKMSFNVQNRSFRSKIDPPC